MVACKSLELDVVLRTIWIASLGAISTGIVGYLIGKILDTPPSKTALNKNQSNNDDMFINDLIIDDIKQISTSENNIH